MDHSDSPPSIRINPTVGLNGPEEHLLEGDSVGKSRKSQWLHYSNVLMYVWNVFIRSTYWCVKIEIYSLEHRFFETKLRYENPSIQSCKV
jgi:hypothetical protein